MAYRNYSTAVSHIVDTNGQGDFTTIAAALTSATSGQTIFIRPGTYTENFTLKNGVDLCSFTSGQAIGNHNVNIIGKMIDNGGSVTCNLYGISFQTNSDYILSTTGTGRITFKECNFIMANNTGFLLNNSSSSVDFYYCIGNFSTTGITLATVTSGNLFIFGSNVANSGSTTTQTTIASGQIAVYYSVLNIPFSTSSTGIITFDHSSIYTFITNSTAILTAGSGTNSIIDSLIQSGSASACSIGAGTILDASGNTINCTNTNAFTGAGTLVHSGNTFSNTGKGINTSTVIPFSFRAGLLLDSAGLSGTTNQLPVATTSSEFTWGTAVVGSGGTGNTTATAYSLIAGGTTTTAAFQGISPVATGQVLISGGIAALPSFSATPTVTSITISNAPSAGTDGTNKTYVDAAVAAVNPATSVTAATTGALTVTYANGVAGIGATLTNAGAQAAFAIDGQSPALASRVLIKNQASTFQNGAYTVTVVGTGATNWVLTRALDYDQPSDINNTGIINVLNGTANAGTGWLINSTVTTVGTDAITYTQFTYPASFFLQAANNLSDVASASTSRTNLGLTAVATQSVTQYNALIGGAANAISSIAPSATTGIPLVSQGSSANPSFSTAVVAGGGTGLVTTTAYGLITGGTTATGNFQNTGTGSSGQFLKSGGSAALPTWVNAQVTGALVEIQTQAASNSASIVFITGITSTYNNYLFVISNYEPVTNNTQGELQISSNGGSSYASTNYTGGSTLVQAGTTTLAATTSTSYVYLYLNITNSQPNASMFLYCSNITNGNQSSYSGSGMQISGGNTYGALTFSQQTTITTINAFKFLSSSGNISTGTFTLYGILE